MEIEEVHEGQLQLPTSSSSSTPATPSRFQMLGRIVGAVWETIEYGIGIKRIKEVKYKHKCAKKLVDLIYRELSKWEIKDICGYFSDDNPLVSAIRQGNVEMLTVLLRHFPFLMHFVHPEKGNILEIAISERQEKVFNLMLEPNNMIRNLASRVTSNTTDTVLHTAAKLAPYPQLSSVSCPALQMQRELQWFKGVEKLVAPRFRAWPNKKYILPQELFTTEHKDLSKEAEQWMKETSNSCMVVATLIATVVFAAAFTVPGGNVDGEGIPLFLKRNPFMVFIVSDAVGMFSSATSILMFLSISTARYAEQDFLYALPMRLIFGFASLFMAIASMMVAFGATLFMVLDQRIRWILFPIIGITSIPVGLFIKLQLPLLIFMVRSTYGSSIFQPQKIW